MFTNDIVNKMKNLLLLFYVLFVPIMVCGQNQNCSATPESIVIRGLRLGMSSSEIKMKFSKVKIPKANNLGYSRFIISFFPLPDRYTSYGEDELSNSIDTGKFVDYKGWQSIEFESIDEKVVSMKITYDSAMKWKNLDEFTSRFSESTKLPNQWLSNSESKYFQKSYMNCEKLRAEAEMTGQTNPIIYFVDTEAPKTMKQRKSALKEKEKKNFKP